jgi:uncharacterized membrane protein (GlpM family)
MQGLNPGLLGIATFGLRAHGGMVAMGFAIPAVAHVAGVYWASPETNLRYLLPIVPGLAILAGLAVARVARNHMGVILAWAIVAVSIVPTLVYLQDRFLSRGDLAYTLGVEDVDAWSMRAGNEALRTLLDADEWLTSLEPGRILFLFEAREGSFQSNVIQDNDLKNWALLHIGLSGRCLSDTIADAVAINELALTYLESRGLDPRSIHWQEFQPFAERCLEFVGRFAGYALYAVKSPVEARVGHLAADWAGTGYRPRDT